MPKKYGVKEKDLVVSHVVNLVLTGKLRSGDRLDRNEIAEQLGLSRVPIQEAVVQLEHDGVLSTRYHRGAYVERFDEGVVREHHELYGMLNGIASARAATVRDPKVLDALRTLVDTMRASLSLEYSASSVRWRARSFSIALMRARVSASLTCSSRRLWSNAARRCSDLPRSSSSFSQRSVPISTSPPEE